MSNYSLALDSYQQYGVDTETAIRKLSTVPISLHCWQGDDIGGFENPEGKITGGGILATGNYPGKASTLEELRDDLEKALSLIPGKHRLNLHACYADFSGGKTIERNKVDIAHFQSWIDWAKGRCLGLDFNPTFFSHPLANDGRTLTHPDEGIRSFWIEHGIACRKIGEEMGRQLGSKTVINIWIPDGYKDIPVDRKGPRELLEKSLDALFCENLDDRFHLDAVESKLFGIGSEAYVAGSHEFYMGYAMKKRIALCLDAGHFHPTEQLADKISSILQFVPSLLLHVSRGVRWDSDHVVLLDDPTRGIMEELVRGDFLYRSHIGLDYFDASINRIAAWVIGTRNTLKALLLAMLEPLPLLRGYEQAGDYTSRLALFEEIKALPFGLVWEEYCLRNNVPSGAAWLQEVKSYEKDVLSRRG